MSCEQTLAWYDNVPLVSYALLRGRCRSCGTAIPWKYPLVELATGLLVAACFLVFGFTWDAAVASFFCATLVAVSVTDLERRIIPNKIVLPAAAVVLVAQTLLHPSIEWVLGGLAASTFLLVAALVYPAGMGMGDVKLALLLGVMLGRVVPVALMIGMLSALVPAIVLLVRHGRRVGRWESRSVRSSRSAASSASLQGNRCSTRTSACSNEITGNELRQPPRPAARQRPGRSGRLALGSLPRSAGTASSSRR